MANCQKCGRELSPDFRFCPQCGTSASELSLTSSQPRMLFGIPLGADEKEIYRAVLASKGLFGSESLFILTYRQIIVGSHKSWLERARVGLQIPFSKISTVRVEQDDFKYWVVRVDFNTPSVNPWYLGYTQIHCNTQQQAVEFATKIREAI